MSLMNWIKRKLGLTNAIHAWIGYRYRNEVDLSEGDTVKRLEPKEYRVAEVNGDRVQLEAVNDQGLVSANKSMLRQSDSHHDVPLYHMEGAIWKLER